MTHSGITPVSKSSWRNMEPDDDKTKTHVTLTSGTMVSHYQIIERIGAGGMGEVYLAEDPELNRKVALNIKRNFCLVAVHTPRRRCCYG
jgi:hypothetical protein